MEKSSLERGQPSYEKLTKLENRPKKIRWSKKREIKL